jgi:hypothetical protein
MDVQAEGTLGLMIMRLLAGFALAACLVPAQETVWNSPDAYLGQTPPSGTPKEFAPGQLADKGAFVMGRLVFSRDGKEFFFTQNDSWKTGKLLKSFYA